MNNHNIISPSENTELEFSPLPKTWIFDVDGTIVKHNGYLLDGYDTLLDGVKEFFDNIPDEDRIVLITARRDSNMEYLEKFLEQNEIRYDVILTDMPVGERILVNDRKPSGLDMAYSVNKNRDEKLCINYKINEEL